MFEDIIIYGVFLGIFNVIVSMGWGDIGIWNKLRKCWLEMKKYNSSENKLNGLKGKVM